MLRELISLFRSDDALGAMGENFTQMLERAYELTLAAGEIYFSGPPSPEARTSIYKQDIKINKLERKVRKQVIAHLSIQMNTRSAPYCLLLMSLVKDVERIGDYAKNLAEVADIHEGPLPEDEHLAELREIRSSVETAFAAAPEVFSTSDQERAGELIREGRGIAHRCDALVVKVARSPHPAGVATALVLGARYYKRIGGHLLNVLTGVVMPLHKLDYYDEDAIPPLARD